VVCFLHVLHAIVLFISIGAVINRIWMAVIGPDTKPLGEVKGEYQLYQNQIANTLAAFLGLSYTNEAAEGAAVKTMLTVAK